MKYNKIKIKTLTQIKEKRPDPPIKNSKQTDPSENTTIKSRKQPAYNEI